MALNANIEAENRKMVKPYKCFQRQGHLEKNKLVKRYKRFRNQGHVKRIKIIKYKGLPL